MTTSTEFGAYIKVTLEKGDETEHWRDHLDSRFVNNYVYPALTYVYGNDEQTIERETQRMLHMVQQGNSAELVFDAGNLPCKLTINMEWVS